MAPDQIRIRVVESKSDLEAFVDFPIRLYRGHPNFVPPLRKSELETFSPLKNPAFEHNEARLFLASRGKEVVGRIAGIINHLENNEAEKRMVRFGWVDFVDDLAVSQALFQAVESWGKQRGCRLIKGPYGFSNMDKAGLLIEGFDELATMAVIYNYPYYVHHLEQMNYSKLVDWHEYEAKVPDSIPEKVTKFAEMIQTRYGLKEYVPAHKNEWAAMGIQIFELINLAYKDLEGFIPHSRPQIELFVKKYLSFVNPDFISIVTDRQNKLIGFGITMPSFSRALQKCKGRLFPFGFLHLRKALKKNDRVDLYLIAVHPDYQNKGVTAIIFNKIIRTCINYGIQRAETNPELESNQEVQNLWRGYDIRLHKKRRCFQKDLD